MDKGNYAAQHSDVKCKIQSAKESYEQFWLDKHPIPNALYT